MSADRPDLVELRAAFRRLHDSGCFIIPNPWDAGTARYLRHLGYQALATTSAGFAFSRGRPDGEEAVPLDMALAHVGDIVAAAGLPVNADFQAGYADEPAGVADNVRRCVETGVAGLSIEDASGNAGRPLHDLPRAVERIQAARSAIDALRAGVLLTGRAECYLVRHPEPLKESIRRLQAYAQAGADVLYAPGAREREDIEEIVAAVAPKPVNVLMGRGSDTYSVPELAAAGAKRISVGGTFARVALGAFMKAAREVKEKGTFTFAADTMTHSEVEGYMTKGER